MVRRGGAWREGAGNGGRCGRPALGPASARPAPLLDLGVAWCARSFGRAPVSLRGPQEGRDLIEDCQRWPKSSPVALVENATVAGCAL